MLVQLTLEPYRSHMFIESWAADRTITPVVSHCITQFSISSFPWRTPDERKGDKSKKYWRTVTGHARRRKDFRSHIKIENSPGLY